MTRSLIGLTDTLKALSDSSTKRVKNVHRLQLDVAGERAGSNMRGAGGGEESTIDHGKGTNWEGANVSSTAPCSPLWNLRRSGGGGRKIS